MTRANDSLPDDVATLKALLVAERAARTAAEAQAKAGTLMIEKLKLAIAKLRHDRFGASSERSTRLIEQLELQLADLEETAAEAEVAAETTALPAVTIPVHGFQRRKPSRRPLPEHLPRERVVYPAPTTCPCCGGGALRKIGEDMTETLEVVPRQWKVIAHVREKFSCRSCEAITQPRRHPRIRSRAGAPGPRCSPTCCSPNTACICPSTGRAPPMPARGSISTSPPSPTGWARQRRR